MSERKHWSQIQEAGAVTGIRILFAIYRYLGRLPFNIALFPVIVYFFTFRSEARHASMEFLQRMLASGKLHNTGPQLWWSFRHFLDFGSSLLDKLAVWIDDISLADIEFHDRDLLTDLNGKKQGGLIIGSHLGNLEICRALSLQRSDLTINVFMHTEHASKFNSLLKKAGSKSQVNVLPVTAVTPATAMLLQEKINRGEFIVIAGDRTPPSGDAHTAEVNFLGKPATFPAGPFILASLLECPVYTLFCLRNPSSNRARYSIYVKLLATQVTVPRRARQQHVIKYIEQYAGTLEQYCAMAPRQWYNFYPFWKSS